MEIIILGKPADTDSKTTLGIDSDLRQKIVDTFFASMNSFLHEQEIFFIDTWYWKGIWYCVYTYYLSADIRDTANRPSFFAISLISQSQYYCLPSEVYNKLRSVCETDIIGIYLDKNGKYKVPTLDDDQAFHKIVDTFEKDFTNLAELFDHNFKIHSDFSQYKEYSIKDCDALECRKELQRYGRIIVRENMPSMRQQYDNLQSALNKQNKLDAEITSLNATITAQQNRITELNNANANSKRTIASTEKELETKTKRCTEVEGYLSAIEQAITNAKIANGDHQETTIKKAHENYLPWMPVCNGILLLIVICLILFSHPSKMNEQSPDLTAENESIITELKKSNSEQQTIINECKNTNLRLVAQHKNDSLAFNQLQIELNKAKEDLVKAKKKELKPNQVKQENKQLPSSSEIKCTLTVSKDGKPLNDGDDVVSGDALSYTYHCEPKQTLEMKVEHFLFEKNSFGIVSGKPSDKVVIECIAPGTNKSLAKITLNIK